jgi:hypothetical protein
VERALYDPATKSLNTDPKVDSAKAISYYSLAAEAWGAAGNIQRRIDALTAEAALLFNQGQGDKSAEIDQGLLLLEKASTNLRGQFVTDLAMAEILQPKGDLDRTAKALQDAESLLSADLTVVGVEPNMILEMYLRLADLHERRNEPLLQVIALEKAMTPAEGVDAKAMAFVYSRLKDKLTALYASEAADKAYTDGDLVTALLYYELIEMDLYAKSIPADRRAAQSGVIGAVLAASVPKCSLINSQVVVGA